MRLFRIVPILSILAIIFYAGSAGSAPSEEWNKTFWGPGFEAFSVSQTTDGGYIIAGMVQPYGDDHRYVLLIKADTNGSEQWNKTFSREYYNMARSVQQTTDGGYILAGEASKNSISNAWLIKTDINGNEQWNRTYGDSSSSWANSVQQTKDGGYILAGSTSRYGRDEVLLIKTDVHGNVQWDRIFEVKGIAEAWSVQKTTDGGYILAGEAKSQESRWYGGFRENFDAWLIKTDMNGSQQWKKTFRETRDYSEGISMAYGPFTAQQTSDRGYILAGSMFWDRENRNPVWLIKVDANGNQQWKKKLGPGWVMSVHQSSDNGYILAGGTPGDVDNRKAWLIKTDTNGNEQWNSTFGRTINGTINSIHQTFDGGYILAGIGYTGSYSDAWLIKVSKEPSEAARNPTPGQTEKVSGFEIVLAITALSAVYVLGRKRKRKI